MLKYEIQNAIEQMFYDITINCLYFLMYTISTVHCLVHLSDSFETIFSYNTSER